MTKYTARFDHIIKASDFVKANTLSISEASQKELKRFVPFIDYSKSQDLMGMAFDVALVNVFNLNGDGICSEGAIKMRPSLTHKPINIEHNRDIIIGHILEGGFSDKTFKKTLWDEDVKDIRVPFNITLGGVIYKIVAKELSEVLSDIQSGKETDFIIASSWEVGFDSFLAAVGTKYLEDCEIISDEAEVERLSPYMKAFGGSGVLPDGRAVNRLIDPNGTIVFLGAGLTKYPAAEVGAVYVFDENERQKDDVPAVAKKEEGDVPEEDVAISHLNKVDVSSLRTDKNNMEKQEIVKLIEEVVASSSGTLTQEALASTTSKIADAIIESNKAFIAEKEAAEAKAAEIEAKAKEHEEKIVSLEQQVAETVKTLAEANEKLQKVEEEAQAALAKEKFNERMSAIDSKFALEDADREIIAKQVSALESDEEFADLEKNLEVLMSAKLKSKIEEVSASVEKKMKEAVAEELKKRGITDPLETKSEEVEKTADLPNNSAEASQANVSLREKFSKAFDKNKIKVTL